MGLKIALFYLNSLLYELAPERQLETRNTREFIKSLEHTDWFQ